MKRMIIKVHGRVQGVFFRHSARIHAAELGITGWARNEGDGSVAICAEGEEVGLEKLIEWCRRGPPLAHVENINVAWEEAKNEFRKFEIL